MFLVWFLNLNLHVIRSFSSWSAFLIMNILGLIILSGGSSNSVSDLKKDELEQLIIQLILDRVLVR